MSENMREEFIGNILSLKYGKSLDKSSRDQNGEFPVYGANGIKDRCNKYLYDKKTIIVGRKGSVGEINFTEEKFWALDVTYYAVFDDDKYDLKFIFYLLKSLDLPNLAKGIKPGLNRNDVYKKKVKVPNKVTQIQISKKLDVLASKKIAFLKLTEEKLLLLDELEINILKKEFEL